MNGLRSDLEFFTDRDLGLAFPDILTASGLRVHRHRDHFAPAARDEEWLATVATRGWVAVTHDRRIRYKPNELAAVVRHRARLLVVVGKAPYPNLARNFVATFPRIVDFLAAQHAPLIGKVYRPPADAGGAADQGRVELWYPLRPGTPSSPRRPGD